MSTAITSLQGEIIVKCEPHRRVTSASIEPASYAVTPVTVGSIWIDEATSEESSDHAPKEAPIVQDEPA